MRWPPLSAHCTDAPKRFENFNRGASVRFIEKPLVPVSGGQIFRV